MVLDICNFLCRLKKIKKTKVLLSAIFFNHILGHQNGVGMRVSRQNLSRNTYSHCKCIFKCPGYTYVALDTFMSPWIHLCHPGYTYVALDTLMSVFITLKLCELHSSALLPPQRDVGIWYGCSHCSHSLSIEIIEKNSLHEFF